MSARNLPNLSRCISAYTYAFQRSMVCLSVIFK